jgi:hypothetical protein
MFNDIKVGDEVLVEVQRLSCYGGDSYHKAKVAKISDKRFVVDMGERQVTFLKSDGYSYPASDRTRAFPVTDERIMNRYLKCNAKGHFNRSFREAESLLSRLRSENYIDEVEKLQQITKQLNQISALVKSILPDKNK